MKTSTMKDGYEWVNDFHCIKLMCPICNYNMSGNINMHFSSHGIRAVTTIRSGNMHHLQCACGHCGKGVDISESYGIAWDAAWNEMYKHWVDGGEEHMAIVLLSQEDQ